MQFSDPFDFVLSILTQNLYLHLRMGPACSLPSSVRFWLVSFPFFAANTAAEGLIYFAHVAVRKFNKTTAI